MQFKVQSFNLCSQDGDPASHTGLFYNSANEDIYILTSAQDTFCCLHHQHVTIPSRLFLNLLPLHKQKIKIKLPQKAKVNI